MRQRLFVDASALVALLLAESDWAVFADQLDVAEQSYTSPLAVLEAVMVVSSRTRLPPEDIEARLMNVLTSYGTEIAPIGTGTIGFAVRAFARFGKGRHPARLNIGDCFSYACAKQHRLALLYKGDDFAQTDLG
jgi:ribonuclease VapC